MKTHHIGIIMNGVTGRMGTNQHLIRSIKAIIDQGGVKLPNGETIMPDPVLTGRNADRVNALAAQVGVKRVATSLDSELANPANQIYFDSTLNSRPQSAFEKRSRRENISTVKSPRPRHRRKPSHLRTRCRQLDSGMG